MRRSASQMYAQVVELPRGSRGSGSVNPLGLQKIHELQHPVPPPYRAVKPELILAVAAHRYTDLLVSRVEGVGVLGLCAPARGLKLLPVVLLAPLVRRVTGAGLWQRAALRFPVEEIEAFTRDSPLRAPRAAFPPRPRVRLRLRLVARGQTGYAVAVAHADAIRCRWRERVGKLVGVLEGLLLDADPGSLSASRFSTSRGSGNGSYPRILPSASRYRRRQGSASALLAASLRALLSRRRLTTPARRSYTGPLRAAVAQLACATDPGARFPRSDRAGRYYSPGGHLWKLGLPYVAATSITAAGRKLVRQLGRLIAAPGCDLRLSVVDDDRVRRLCDPERDIRGHARSDP